MFQKRKGFTLIELLIVITIIGILAVAFLPTLLGAPAKGRDTQRIADLQKLQKVMVNADLEGEAFPVASACLNAAAYATGTTPGAFNKYLSALGGAYPEDPSPVDYNGTVGSIAANCGTYVYLASTEVTGYQFGLYTKVENKANGNAKCSLLMSTPTDKTKPTEDDDACYSILVE